MTAHQNPPNGGSYMRNADGSLTHVDEDGNPIVEAADAEDIVTAPVEAALVKPGRAARAADPALTEKEA